MKFNRIIAVILCLLMCAVGNIPAFASDNTDSSDFENAVYYTCIYDHGKDQIVVEGTVNHDAMIKFKDHEILVYAIAPGCSYDQLISDAERVPVVSTSMTIRFSFRIDVHSSIDRFSRYVIVLRSPQGEEYLVDEPMIPNVASDFNYTYEERVSFKGLHTPLTSDITASGAGTVIVDINIDEVVGDTSDSILYFMNDKYFYMRRSYVSDIDTKVRSASVMGGKVYLRFLLDATRIDLAICQDEQAYGKYSIPDLYKEEVLDVVSAVSGFFSERYNNEKGSFYGIILGDRIDDVENANHIGELTAESYADMYALYLAVVANTVRITHPHVDIVIPLSGINDYSSDAGANMRIRPSRLLEDIVAINDANFANEFKCSVMISASTVPFNLSNKTFNGRIDMSSSGTVGLLGTDNIAAFVSFMDSLSKTYNTAPDNLIYHWDIPTDLEGSALCCAYIYSYYRLYTYGKVSAFIASFDEDSNCYRSVASVFKYIDTDMAGAVVDPFAEFFGKNSWSEILGMPITSKSTHKLFESTMNKAKSDNIVGEFCYIDFTESQFYDNMLAGDNCEYMQIATDALGSKALVARSSSLAVGERFELFSVLDYPESYTYTPYISLILSVDSGLVPSAPVYEVTLTLGDGTDIAQAVGVLDNGKRTELIFDASAFSDVLLSDRLKISIRCLTGDTGRISVSLYELVGYSEEYTSNNLGELVEILRQEIRMGGYDRSSDEANAPRLVLTVIGIVFAIAAVAATLMIIFRRDEVSEEE